MDCGICTEPLNFDFEPTTHQEYGTICDDCNNSLIKCSICDVDRHEDDLHYLLTQAVCDGCIKKIDKELTAITNTLKRI